MTNFEYYKDKILEIGDVSEIALGKDGEMYKCINFPDCEKCMFEGLGDCGAATTKWLYEEHVEKPKLTKKERIFCELIEKGYIARDENDNLFAYTDKPRKEAYSWNLTDGTYSDLSELSAFSKLDFSFIKWEDKEPWSVEELIKLEVE